MNSTKLDNAFKEAYQRASNTSLRFPQDLMLHFYAYYKHATEEDTTHVHQQATDGTELVSAFKMNSLFQIRNLSRDEAKRKYIELVNKHIPK
ncbi:MAG TPA: acyl-CoA-binding protein [Flavobacteriaceae bacterium]|nr:acyl-CoA-binding protein [Flavobacteriaceae bacterium]